MARSKRPDLAQRNRDNATHGMSNSSAYKVWRKMKKRCSNPADKDYEKYGGRGIFVCERWQKFENFLEDMGDRPEGLQLDRINNDGPYTLENCRWTTAQENSNNRRSSKFVTHKGRTLTAAQWARELNIGPKTFLYRLKSGWSMENVFELKVSHSNRNPE